MRYITVGIATDKYSHFPILDEDADRLIRGGILYECGETEGEHADHDLHLDPMYEGSMWDAEEVLVAIGQAHAEWESDHTLHTTTLTMSASIPALALHAMDEDKLEKRKEFYFRNLALNLATNAVKHGLLEQSEICHSNGDLELKASFTAVPPSKKGAFSAISRLYVASLIDNIAGVDEKRKSDAIELIKMLK